MVTFWEDLTSSHCLLNLETHNKEECITVYVVVKKLKNQKTNLTIGVQGVS